MSAFAFARFVLLGYVDPITWTGFRGQTPWNWLTLLVLPLSIATLRVWTHTGRDLRRRHLVAAMILGTALVITVVDGETGRAGTGPDTRATRSGTG